ncbi:MAG: hypothetical protein E7590_06815 [Ruminococcaceae bacterium]|nr:hypothetical protein [Oscillospiraceae bacterium]
MKRFTSILLALVLCLATVLTLTACDHEHTYANDWTGDETHHWHACTGKDCTEVADKAEHTWNNGEITTPATRETNGVKTFTCTACNKTKTEAVIPVLTVTAEQWDKALSFEGLDNYTITLNNGTSTTTAIRNGFKVQLTTDDEIMYLNKEGETYYSYIEESGSYVKSDIPEAVYINNATLGTGGMFQFSDVAYDETTKSYTAAEVSPSGTPFTYANIVAKFLDGKLVHLSCDGIMNGTPVGSITMTVIYGNAAAITLPSVTA